MTQTKIKESFSGYSPTVAIDLIVGSQRYAVAEAGPTFVVLREPCSCPPTDAVVEIAVDEHVTRTNVTLPEGLNPSRFEQPLVSVP